MFDHCYLSAVFDDSLSRQPSFRRCLITAIFQQSLMTVFQDSHHFGSLSSAMFGRHHFGSHGWRSLMAMLFRNNTEPLSGTKTESHLDINVSVRLSSNRFNAVRDLSAKVSRTTSHPAADVPGRDTKPATTAKTSTANTSNTSGFTTASATYTMDARGWTNPSSRRSTELSNVASIRRAIGYIQVDGKLATQP